MWDWANPSTKGACGSSCLWLSPAHATSAPASLSNRAQSSSSCLYASSASKGRILYKGTVNTRSHSIFRKGDPTSVGRPNTKTQTPVSDEIGRYGDTRPGAGSLADMNSEWCWAWAGKAESGGKAEPVVVPRSFSGTKSRWFWALQRAVGSGVQLSRAADWPDSLTCL